MSVFRLEPIGDVELAAPVLVAAFDGWVDAAGASSAATDHLARGGELIATFQLLAVGKGWMDRTFAPDGYHVGWNCEATGGQTLMHAHMHVIPRFRQEPLAGQGIRSLLKSDANRW